MTTQDSIRIFKKDCKYLFNQNRDREEIQKKFQKLNILFLINISLSRGRREREMLRITKENMELFKRIHSKKPAISRDQLKRDWEKNLQFMDNISAFPEDWYLRDNKHTSTRSSHSLNKSISYPY